MLMHMDDAAIVNVCRKLLLCYIFRRKYPSSIVHFMKEMLHLLTHNTEYYVVHLLLILLNKF